MVINSSDKSPFEICDSTGREFKEIYDIQGRLLFKNWSELSGIPPLNFTSRADYLPDYRIYGNTVQDGTPTPENPVKAQGCGERTENLFEKIVSATSGKVYRQIYVGDGYFTLSTNAPLVNGKHALFFLVSGYTDSASANIGVPDRAYDGKSCTVNSVDEYVTVVYRYVFGRQPRNYQTMLTPGSTPPDHYIPYGYKIPVTVSDGTNSITTPVYLGSEPLHKIGDYADYVDFKRGVVVRRIKKLVLTGKEDYSWHGYTTYLKLPYTNFVETDTEMPSTKSTKYMKCSHFRVINTNTPTTSLRYGMCSYGTGRRSSSNFGRLLIGMDSSSDDDFDSMKNFIAAQYSAGTPVTIWYVIATPEEELLENLLPIQTIKGTNILTVDTTVQPSEMYIKYRR